MIITTSEHAEAQGFTCPHCGAGPYQTRNDLRKHIFDTHKQAQIEMMCSVFEFETTLKEDQDGGR